MVSVKDIARECNVSIATVSKALNNYGDIGETTREKVKECAERLGYFPNSSARALKTKRSYNLGVLFKEDANSGLTHDFFSHVLESLRETAEENGYDITFTSQYIARRKMTYLEHCVYRGLDGVVIACVDFSAPAVQELIQSDLPVVTIDHVFDNRIAVVSDNVHGMRDLAEYVISRGHKKIAYIHGLDSSVTRARVASFHHTLAEHGLSAGEEYTPECPYRDYRLAAKLTEDLLALKEPPTCILYPDDYSCFGGYNDLVRRGYRIGQDISIAGYDGIELTGLLNPQLTTIHQDTDSIGSIAARKLISLIEEPKTTIIDKIVVPGALVEGGTVADLTGTGKQ